MRLGISLPQGCDREYIGLSPDQAWRRTIEIAQLCEEAGFESLWINDHFQVDPPVVEAPIFESFVELAGLAMVTRRARLGHLVLAAAYRNPALTAKAISSIDVISGGRAVLGIGAGWKEDEWLAYGYGFPDVRTRLAILRDALEVISRMLAPGRATYRGPYAHVIDAVHEPKGAHGPVPILIGGNGPNVTWRLAARFADELNLDALTPAPDRRRATGHPGALRGDRPRPRHPEGLGLHLGSAGRREARPGACRAPARVLGGRTGHGHRAGLHGHHRTRCSGLPHRGLPGDRPAVLSLG